jgi:hypothetical protein
MIGRNLWEMTGSSEAEADGLGSLRGHWAQSNPVMLREFRPDKSCQGVPRSRLFANPDHIYSISPSNIRLIPDSGRTSRLIPRAGDANRPIGTHPARNRGMSSLPGLSNRAASADYAGDNIRLSARYLQVICLMLAKPERGTEFSRISAMRTHVRKNPHPARVEDRSRGSRFAGRSNAPNKM